MAEEKIIQIMPIDRKMPMQSGCILSWQEPNADKTDNVEWFIMGAALMDSGRVLPLVWDGYWTFKTVDPVEREWERFYNNLYVKLREERHEREKRLHDAGITKEDAPTYWDSLTSGEYPRTAEAAKMLKLDAEDKQINGGKVV